MARSPAKRSLRRASRTAAGERPVKASKMRSSSTSHGKFERTARTAEASRAYDTWLDHRLKSLYEPILAAPLPDDMLKLLRSRKS